MTKEEFIAYWTQHWPEGNKRVFTEWVEALLETEYRKLWEGSDE